MMTALKGFGFIAPDEGDGTNIFAFKTEYFTPSCKLHEGLRVVCLYVNAVCLCQFGQ